MNLFIYQFFVFYTVKLLDYNSLNLIKNSKALLKVVKFLNVSDLAMSIMSKIKSYS